MNPVKFLEGLILGALTGAAIVLFVTPKSGQDLQSDVRERVNTILDESRRAAAERRAELEAQFAQARQAKPITLK